MTLHPQSLAPISEDTVRVVRAAFPKSNLYMRMRDELGVLFNDERIKLTSFQGTRQLFRNVRSLHPSTLV